MKKIFFNRIVSVVSSVLVSVMAVALVGYAATTISTDIDTGGTLTVSGASTLSGNLALNGGSATTTITGGLRADTAQNTLVVDFSSSRVGIGTTSPSVLFSLHGAAIFGAADADVISFRSGTLELNANATTTITTKGNMGIAVNTDDLVLDVFGNLFGVATSAPRSTWSVHGDTLLGSADGSIASFRAGDIQFNSNATTTITTKNLRGINVNAGDFVIDTQTNTAYVGTSTPLRGTFGVDGTGTTTLGIYTSTASPRGTCIEMNNATNGGLMRIYATSSDIGTLRVEPGGCDAGS